ncbi:MAG TPA: type II toxin-antitoxin system RelE/ParE family toxin [Coxiellaceae bacterium]|nr:MAG: plasmid stabilization protein [Gammaproteobacteria bacterium RIFCSPHIGHO2_12_FULL_36_30]HLB57082.1 type II toxin-antitoxin system RelE/ParE family toxin [Coxiellaceae bacterium]
MISYKLLIKKEARKTLKTIGRIERNRITEKIVLLGKNPSEASLDIKPLTKSDYYRLRVGKWRIIFDRDDDIKIIAIEKIKSRGDVYK